MKKIILIVSCIALIASCRKRDDNYSTVEVYSTPTITLSGQQYYSINVGDEAPVITATAYDSFYNEFCEVSYDASGIDNTTPGIYSVPMTARNHFKMEGRASVVVAVTNIADSIDLSGEYLREATGGTANVTKVARGLYETDNVGGNAGASTHAFFLQLAPDTMIAPTQPTTDGDMEFPTANFVFDANGVLTSYTYTINNQTYGKSARTFVRQ
jgi:hypothetical protein